MALRTAATALALCLSAAGVARAQFGPAIVSVAPVIERKNAEAGHAFVGSVQPLRRSVIGSAVAGRVLEFPINAGDRVKAKQPLAQLLTRQLDIQIAAARADLQLKQQELAELKNGARAEEVREAKAKTAAAQALHEYMTSKLQRTKALFERNAVSEDQLQDDVSRALAATQTFAAVKASEDLVVAGPRAEKIAQAEARVAMAVEEVNRLEDLLVKHTITTPFDGYVVAEHTEVGQWIESGGLVAEVEDLAEVELEAQVLENYLDHVRIGTSARIEVPALPNEKFVGQVTTIVPRADERSRNFPVKVRMQNRFDAAGTPLLKSGMFARLWLPVEKRDSVLLVPQDAVVLGGPAPMVYVAERDKSEPTKAVARPIPIQLGSSFDEYFEATGPIAVGMDLVIEGNERLRPGQEMRIVPASRTAAPTTSAAK